MLDLAFGTLKRTTLLFALGLSLVWLTIYASTVSPSVNFIDSGELITALHEPGIAHPPGYPLYTLMGYVVSNILWGDVAWRVNILSAFWGAMAVGTAFLLIMALVRYLHAQAIAAPTADPPRGRKARAAVKTTHPPATQDRIILGQPPSVWLSLVSAAAAASLLGASSTFWSRTAQAKMYTLHYFFVALLFLLALLARWAYERADARIMRRALIVLSTAVGLSLANHLMTTLLVPALLLTLWVGSDPWERIKAMLRSWYCALPAVLIPVLLYLYLPWRASQQPLMNWGSTDSWGDFWRHITGWQYGAYLVTDGDERGRLIARLWGYISAQWSWQTPTILGLCVVAGGLLARACWPLLVCTLVSAVTTFGFATVYGISEIEPYLVPLYMMLLLWLGMSVVTVRAAVGPVSATGRKVNGKLNLRVASAVAVLLAICALVTALIQYPSQDHSDDRLAEQFVNNVFTELPENSILITDYWDFYAPTIYLQNILKLREDIAVVDMSLVTYPWYLGYLQKRTPSLMANSQDIVETFRVEQRKWVNGQMFDSNLLQTSYIALLTSFVERNIATRPAYVLFEQCPSGRCNSSLVAPGFDRQRVGLTSRLVRRPAPAQGTPKEPDYKLEGIVTGSRVPMDDFARLNSCLYAQAYAAVAQQFNAANRSQDAQRIVAMVETVRRAIPGQCR